MAHFFKICWFFLVVCTILTSCSTTPNQNPNHEFTVDKLIDSANHLAENGKLNKAIYYLDSSFKNISNPGISDLWKTYYFKHKRYYWEARGDHKKIDSIHKSILYADSMLNLIKSSDSVKKYKNELSVSYFSKGDALLEQGKYQEAYINYYEGKLLVNNTENTCENGRFNSRLANLNYLQENYHLAASLYKQVYLNNLDCKLDEKKFGEIQGALNNAGLSYLKIKMPDSAMYCFQKSLQFVEKNERLFPGIKNFVKNAKGVIFQFIGDVYLDSGNIKSAELYLKKSIDFNKNSRQGITNAQSAAIKLARLYLASSKYSDYKSTSDFVKSSLDSVSDLENSAGFQKLEIDYFNQTKNYDKAQQLSPGYLSIRNKITEKSRKINQIDVGTAFYNLQKDYELNLLKKENEVRKLYLAITASLTVLLLLFLFQVWHNWRKTKNNNLKLLKLNEQITDQNLNLQETLMALEKSELEHNKIMKVIAHDLRSPISAIASLAGMMEEDEEFAESGKHSIGLIKASATGSIKFINELLNKESTGKQVERELVELDTLLKYCISLLKFKAEEKNQTIELQSNPVVVNINREQIWRVISNLITNAIKFSEQHQTIRLILKSTSQKVIISVSDRGIGIPEDMSAKIFNAGPDIKRSGTGGEKSYGLGLFISKQIVEAHGGLIWFESIPFKGTTFFVELPIK